MSLADQGFKPQGEPYIMGIKPNFTQRLPPGGGIALASDLK